MTPAREKQLELLRRRIELLRMLIRTESEWRRAFIAFDMQASERHSADERIVTEQIYLLDREIASLAVNGTSDGPDTGMDDEIRDATRQMALLHSDLRRSNQIRMAILRRAQLTLNALRNLFDSYAPAYTAPAAAGTGTLYRESV